MSIARQALLGLGAAACAFVLFRGTTSSTRHAPEDAIPEASFLVASVDVDALRASPVTGPFVSPSAATFASSLEKACGFDPLTRVHRAAAAVPEEATERGTFGVAARVDIARAELLRCAEGLAKDRPGTPVRERGRFRVLGGSDAPAIAIDEDGLLLVSKGPWLDAMIDAANDPRTRLTTTSAHGRLRSALTTEPAMRAPAVLVTLLLPEAVRARIRGEMTEAGAAAGMMGVLGVGAVGLAVALPAGPGRVLAHVELVCDDEASARALVTVIEQKRFELGKSMPLRLVGLGPFLDAITVEQAARSVHVRASADGDALAQVAARVGQLTGTRPHPPP